MSNINVRVIGTANVTQMSGAFGRLEAQVAALNAQLAKMVALNNGVDPRGFNRAARAATAANGAYRDAVGSTGMFHQQQLSVNSATDDYIKKLDKQQMSFRKMAQLRAVASKAYREQLAMEHMTATQTGGTRGGRQNFDVNTPNQVSSQMDTFGRRAAFMNAQLRSGATQMVNWGKNMQWSGRQLSVGLTAPIVAVGAAAGVMAYQIDKELTRVQKVYDTVANANSTSTAGQIAYEKELMSVRKAGVQTAINAASQYGSAAVDTLNVQAELAATGKTGADLQQATNEVMRISRLGEIDHQDAIGATIALQSVFRMSNQELTESFDYMNAVENATSLSTQDFALAIPIAAAPVKAFGGDIKELGVLLTAMKEQGIEASQGANALKATMQRLGRPSKQIREEFAALTGGGDIEQIVDSSGSLTEIFTKLHHVTEDLNKNDQRKVFAGLFGSYQVTKMMALTKGMGELEDGIGQVSKAQELAGGSASDWADTAEQEIERYRNSISGQFDTAWQSMKIQLSTLGKPFVQIATLMLKGISKIIDGFNSLPGPVKTGLAALIGVAALAGPIIMLTGLFGILFGAVLKGGAFFIGLAAKMKILDAESRLAVMASNQVANSLNTERSSASLLRIEIEKLTAARIASNAIALGAVRGNLGLQAVAARATAAAAGTAVPVAPAATTAAASSTIVATNTRTAAEQSERTAKNWKNIRVGMAGAAVAGSMLLMGAEGTVGQAAKIVFYAALLGPMLTPLAIGMVGGFKTASGWLGKQTIQMRTNLALAIATARAQTAGAAGAAAGARTAGAAGAASVAATRAKTVGAVFMATFRVIGTALKTFAKAIGPVGWVITGALVLGGIWKGINDRQKEAREDQEALLKKQRDTAVLLKNSAQSYADITGTTLKNLQGIQRASVTATSATKQQELLALYNSEDAKPIMDPFKAAGSRDGAMALEDSEQYRQASQRFYELQVQNGQGAQEAAANIRAMYIAAGRPMFEADQVAESLLENIGNVKKASLEARVEILNNLAETSRSYADPEALKTGAMELWDTFANEFERAATPAEATQLMQPLTNAVRLEWAEAFAGLSDDSKSALAEIGVTNADEFKKMLQMDTTNMPDDYRTAMIRSYQDTGTAAGKVFADATEGAAVFERSLVGTGKAATGITGEFANLDELFMEGIFTAKSEKYTLSKAEGLADKVQNLISQRGFVAPDIQEENESELTYDMAQIAANAGLATNGIDSMGDALTVINSLLPKGNNLMSGFAESVAKSETNFTKLKDLAARGLIQADDPLILQATQERQRLMKEMLSILDSAGIKTGNVKTLQQAQVALQKMFNRDLGAVPGKMDAAAAGAGALANALAASGQEMSQMEQSGMQGVQDDIADSIRESFDEQMDSAIEGRENYWEKRGEAQKNRFEAAQRAMDTKWENKNDAAEKYWDARIDKVGQAIEAEEKAEEKRQAMFDAEMERIDRLNDAMNTNIDFNVALNEGNFDEAAKIRNDISANANKSALEAAAAAGGRGSERRTEALGGKQENLEQAKDAYMKRLKKQEDAEKRHMQKVQDMRSKALQQEQENDMESVRETWENRKESLDEQLKLFTSYIAKNEKDLKKHMGNVGLSYDAFGEVLKQKGEDWTSFFNKRMQYHIRAAGLALQSDKMWEDLGKRGSKGILKGMGFMNIAQFVKFVNTGEMPKITQEKVEALKNNLNPFRHTGGVVDGSAGSRKGVARTTKGLHSSEQVITAQKGEYLVQKGAVKGNEDILDTINSGGQVMGAPSRQKFGTGGEPLGIAGLMAGGLARGMMTGLAAGMQKGYAKSKAKWDLAKAAQNGTAFGSFGVTGAGTYGDRSFSETQLKHAATIASVGSGMGMSTRDIEIGIMTAITESGLSLPDQAHSDRDSGGLFQQRPSQGWGTVAQVMDPEYASRAFFNALKGIGDRGGMSPWAAAQAVQRSAFSDGSNYQQYWDEAQAIFTRGLSKTKKGYDITTGGVSPGGAAPGGFYRVSTPGKGWSNSHDYRNAYHSPLYAMADGVVTAKQLPPSAGSGEGDGAFPRGYGSYGVMSTLKTDNGHELIYAHLWPGTQVSGRVAGGQKIAESAATGNATGAHTHFTINGSYAAKEFFSAHGIPLKKGGTVKRDGTPAVLHKNERVLTSPLTKKLDTVVDALYRGAKDKGKATTAAQPFTSLTGGGKGGKKRPKYDGYNYTPSGTGEADSPYTWFDTNALKTPKNITSEVSGSKASLKIGTLNAWVKASAKSTIADLKKLIPSTDFLALTEMGHKYHQIRAWLATQNWGALGGGSVDKGSSIMAYNKGTQSLEKKGQRLLGKRKADIIGGRTLRYANYGLFKDKESGRKTWQVAAHTVPAGRGLNAKNAPLYHEQWGNLNKLTEDLQNTGAPTFVSGDLNVHKGRSNFQTPGGLNEVASRGVDYVFGDKKLTKLLSQRSIGGMHTDHGGALMSNFSIPQMKVGGKVMFDNTIANLHKNERVLTAQNTKALDIGLSRLANGPSNTYNVSMVVQESNDGKKLFKEFQTMMERETGRKPTGRNG